MKVMSSKTRIFFWSIKQLLLSAPCEAIFLFTFVLLQGLIPAASLYSIQAMIDWISLESSFPYMFVSIWTGLLLADTVLSPIVSIFRLHLNEKFLCHCNVLLMEKASAIQGLDSFENSKLYDEIQFLKNESSRRPLNFVYVCSGFLKECIALIAVLFVLGSLEWWVPIAMFLASLPHAFSTFWFEKQSWDQMLFSSPEARKLGWIASLPLDGRIAKELRLFAFGDYLIQKYKQGALALHIALSKERWKKSFLSIFLSGVTVLGYLFILSQIIIQTKNKALEISELVVAIQALVMTQSQLSGCISYTGMMTPIILFFSKLKRFLASSNHSISDQNSKIMPVFTQEISFENVSFSYPDGRCALTNVSFKIRKGEKIGPCRS
ncbi:ABC transporter ATP-binding protein [Candidatus Protochlamydia sp. R18]|uniref:ABC transporter ATP-binding protein n=1 Tax=Candidatus Protochlamydia sp. R18 TaxID=1353977 RepID=UPI0005A883B2|nr:ABC transporter ATP-binding protein [Candidatus Protochlamydia sp. R18]